MNDERSSVDEFNFDLRRSLILSGYIHEWGIPQDRVKSRREGHAPLEVYFFPGRDGVSVSRFATVGVSAQEKSGGEAVNHELLFVLPKDFGGARKGDIFNYMLDVAAYAIEEEVVFGAETIIPESPLAPDEWGQRALLIDEARGESKYFEAMHVGAQHISLLWVVPIYNSEYKHISEHGIESFDAYCGDSKFSLVDLARPEIVKK